MYSANQFNQVDEVYLQGISQPIMSINQSVDYYDSATDLGANENINMAKGFKEGKRKGVSQTGTKHSNSPSNRLKTINCQQEIEVSNEINTNVGDQDEKRDENEESYVHVRAKRGQATNSHSLAERVRREKISERMRLLQDLVPGCNKITGKAMMLDEIINYVQSLQRQVEFLSMKLSTICPQINFDIEQMISSENGIPLYLGSVPSLSNINSNFYGLAPQEISQHENLLNIPNSSELQHGAVPHFPTIPQATGIWDEELQNLFHMGFDPNAQQSTIDNSDPMKVE